MTERVLVVGAGAIGGVAAAHMTRAGHDVVVVDPDRAHTTALRDPGLLLEELDGRTSRVPLQAVSSVDDLTGRFDFALLTVKSLFLHAAVEPLVRAGRVDTYVSLGNGLVQTVVESIVGRERLIVGLVEWGATNIGPGHLRQTTSAPMVIGEIDGTETERLRRLRRLLTSVAPDTRTSSSIGGQVWSKLLLNSTFSGLGAAGGCLYRDIVADPVGRDVALRLWTEGYDTAVALGMELGEVFGVAPEELVTRDERDRATAEAALDRLMVRAGATKASMLQDLERGRRTEVDVINGGVVEAAAAIGREAPLNAELTRIVHEYEEGFAQPSTKAFERLQAVRGDVASR
jgi:2-dehydropantoate 2-reductase